MSIDHAKAKATAFHFSHNTPNVTEPCVVNLALAHIDLHEQLSAERARVDALAELVQRAFYEGRDTDQPVWVTSGANKQLSRIMEGRA